MPPLSLTAPGSAPFICNFSLGWIWIVAGFVAGALLGMGFQKEDFLGGYTSFRRRLYRLAHIAFFGTGILNLLFFLTACVLGPGELRMAVAGWAFLVGALAMPFTCLLCGSFPKLKSVFALPVVALTTGGVLTCLEVILR